MQPLTKKRYKVALDRFLVFARRQALSLATTDALDDALELYLNDLYIGGAGRSAGANAYAAVQRRWPKAHKQVRRRSRH